MWSSILKREVGVREYYNWIIDVNDLVLGALEGFCDAIRFFDNCDGVSSTSRYALTFAGCALS